MRNLHTTSHNVSTRLHSHQEHGRFLLSPVLASTQLEGILSANHVRYIGNVLVDGNTSHLDLIKHDIPVLKHHIAFHTYVQ